MLKFGIVGLLESLAFGVVAPFALHRLRRRIGAPAVLGLGLLAGLGYGAIKATDAWSGHGLASNLTLMATSGLVALAYAALSLAATSFITKAVSKRPFV
jgi:hypothetical protein